MAKKRMSDDTEKRGFLNPCFPVIAYERGKTRWFHSLGAVVGNYGLTTVNQLQRLINTGATAPDGYTTFDYAIEGFPYKGMKARDVEKYVDEKYKDTD